MNSPLHYQSVWNLVVYNSLIAKPPEVDLAIGGLFIHTATATIEIHNSSSTFILQCLTGAFYYSEMHKLKKIVTCINSSS